MNSQRTPETIIKEILEIERMEHGSLSIIKQGPKGPYYNLNSWEGGKNRCRYIPRDKVPEVQEAIEGYQKFQQLTQEYAEQVVEKTRSELDIGVKKNSRTKKSPPAGKSSWPKSKKSAS